jgi:hypothetical protein
MYNEQEVEPRLFLSEEVGKEMGPLGSESTSKNQHKQTITNGKIQNSRPT